MMTCESITLLKTLQWIYLDLGVVQLLMCFLKVHLFVFLNLCYITYAIQWMLLYKASYSTISTYLRVWVTKPQTPVQWWYHALPNELHKTTI